jgi:hypothetical protein
MDELRQQLIADKGGPECISTAERVMIDLTVEAAVRHQRVSAYLAEMPSLVDKKHRKVFTVVRDSAYLGAQLQSLLKDLGLERRAKPVPDIRRQLGLD